ncbi:MAG TPA: hypothetical protein VIS06_22025 [Mycobacteriales bacterium]
MLTVPVLVVALVGTISLGVGIAIGGVGIIGGFLVAAGCAYGAVRLMGRLDNVPVARFPGGAMAGVATVLSYENVGATAHDEPMLRARLRISVPGRSPREVTCYDVVSLYAANRLLTNAAFRCAVDPAVPDDVVVHWDQPVTLDGFSDPQNRLGVHTPVRTDASLSAAALLAAGLPGQARIVQSSSQGTVAPNGDPIMIFVLHVIPDNGSPPFQSLTAQRVPPECLSLTVPGTPLRVGYDPENRTRMVAIDWEAAAAGTPVGSPVGSPAGSPVGVGVAGASGRIPHPDTVDGPDPDTAPLAATATPGASN